MLVIKKNIHISDDCLVFKFSRSSGPGGQNVNKLNTRVTLLFDVVNCPDLSTFHKDRILKLLRKRISKEGVLRIISQEHRTQPANRQAAIEKFTDLLSDTLETKPIRKKTKKTYGSIQRRLEKKKQRSTLKKQRGMKHTTTDD